MCLIDATGKRNEWVGYLLKMAHHVLMIVAGSKYIKAEQLYNMHVLYFVLDIRADNSYHTLSFDMLQYHMAWPQSHETCLTCHTVNSPLIGVSHPHSGAMTPQCLSPRLVHEMTPLGIHDPHDPDSHNFVTCCTQFFHILS